MLDDATVPGTPGRLDRPERDPLAASTYGRARHRHEWDLGTS